MKLKLSEENLRYAWGSATEYWFSRTDYNVYKFNELPTDDEAKLVELGFIPFVTISIFQLFDIMEYYTKNPILKYMGFYSLNQ